MQNSIIPLLLTAVGVYAVSSAQPFNRTVNPRGPEIPEVPRQTSFQNEQQNLHNLLLKAAGSRVGAVAPGKMRIPIPVDGVLYEVIVVSPSTVPRLIPASRDNAD